MVKMKEGEGDAASLRIRETNGNVKQHPGRGVLGRTDALVVRYYALDHRAEKKMTGA